MSNRRKLRDLVRKYPDWTNKQYADYLGQSTDVVRGALSAMGLSRFKVRTPKPKKKRRRKVELEVVEPRSRPSRRPTVYVASRSGPTSSGYLKLM